MPFTPNYTLEVPAPGTPAQKNAWGTMENTGRTLVDDALGGNAPFPVTGGITSLTSTPGAPDQSRHAHYTFTGTLSSDQTVLWPQGLGRMFSVINNTTGSFNLFVGADNGSGAVAGKTINLPVGIPIMCRSDGTDVVARVPYEQYFQVTSPVPGAGGSQPSGAFPASFAVSWPKPFANALTGFSAVPDVVANGNFGTVTAVTPGLTGTTLFITSGQQAVGVPFNISVRGW